MSATNLAATPGTVPHALTTEQRLLRTSARFGLAFAVCQLAVVATIALVVLPHAGSPDAPAIERGANVLEAATVYRFANAGFMVAGMLILGFLGVVAARLRATDRSGVLATVAIASGTLLALIWPLSGMLHDVAIETAQAGTDVRILAGWDSIAPYSLAFSVLPRVFFVGAIVMSLRLEGSSGPWMPRIGVAILPLSLVGSATLIFAELFPVLALSTVAFQIWIGAVAWHWIRSSPEANPQVDRLRSP